MNKLNASMLPLVGISVTLSLAALIAVAARWPDTTQTTVMVPAAHPAVAMQTVRVVMHDPGCHWFQTASGFKRSLTVSGPVRLTNTDEATLKITGRSGVRLAKVGSAVRIPRGSYRITMVGQAPDDNHLHLRVS